ncbi:cytochrome c3 family protein [Streptomyces sp. NPDC006923]
MDLCVRCHGPHGVTHPGLLRSS